MKIKTAFVLSLMAISTISAQPKGWNGKTDFKDGVLYVYNENCNKDRSIIIQARNLLTVGGESASNEYVFNFFQSGCACPDWKEAYKIRMTKQILR